MINKILKITIAQIIMWVLACLADAVYCLLNNYFMENVCYFILPICLLIEYILIWWSNYSNNKQIKCFKKLFQNGVYLVLWCLETYFLLDFISGLIARKKWIINNQSFLPWGIYFYWALFAIIIPIIAVIMRLLCTLIKHFNQKKIIHNVFNVLIGMGIGVSVYIGITTYAAWEYFAVAILAAIACFFFNWCYYKVQ